LLKKQRIRSQRIWGGSPRGSNTCLSDRWGTFPSILRVGRKGKERKLGDEGIVTLKLIESAKRRSRFGEKRKLKGQSFGRKKRRIVPGGRKRFRGLWLRRNSCAVNINASRPKHEITSSEREQGVQGNLKKSRAQNSTFT